MVKVIKTAPMGAPDIVRFHDLTGSGTAPAYNPVGVTGAAPSPLVVAKDAVNSIDSWINIADKGITMLGRVDSILARVQTLQRPGQQQQQGPGAPAQQPAPTMLHAPPADMQVNADPDYRNAPAPVPVQQAPPGDLPGPAAGPAPGVPLDAIVRALDMIATGSPGITVEQLSAGIKRNPVQVQHILDAFAAGSM